MDQRSAGDSLDIRREGAMAKVRCPGMVSLFTQIEALCPAARIISLIADNATHNRAAIVREWPAGPDCRARVVCLPPCAPNLKLIERLWRFFRKKALWNTRHASLADFRAAIRGFLANLGQWKAELASLITNRIHPIHSKSAQISAA